MTPEERARAAKERALAYYLAHELESEKKVIELLIYYMPDNVLDQLVSQFVGSNPIPPLIEKKPKKCRKKEIFEFEYTYEENC